MKRDLVSAVVLVFVIFAGAVGRATPRRGPLSLVARFAVRAPLLGRSQQGRPIVAWRVGDPRGTRVLVVGCIHGNEYAGIAVVRALERPGRASTFGSSRT